MERNLFQRKEHNSHLTVTLLLLLFWFLSYTTAVCPAGWQTWTSSTLNPQVQKCFKFESSIGTYSDAKTFCQNNGGEIVNIDSSEENEFIFDHIAQMQQSSSFPGYNSFWLGADSLATSGGIYKFVNSAYNGYDPTHWWDPASNTGIGYWNWWPAEPAHVGSEHCAVMQGSYNKHWSDEDCESVVFIRSAACQLVGNVPEVSTFQTTSLGDESSRMPTSTQITTKPSSSTKDTTTDVTTSQTTVASTTQRPTTTQSQSMQPSTHSSSSSDSYKSLAVLADEFIRKGKVCLLNFSLAIISTENLNRCAGLCVRQETCASFSFISLSHVNQCMLYSVSKDSEFASLTYELSPGLTCLYFERR